MKKAMTLLMIILFVFIVGCGKESDSYIRANQDCDVSAGYSYDEEIKACVIADEVKSSSVRSAATTAAAEVGGRPGLTIVSVEEKDCEDCYSIKLESKTAEYRAEIMSGEIVHSAKVVEDDWCDEKRGVARDSCETSEINIGEVAGTSEVCCVVPA